MKKDSKKYIAPKAKSMYSKVREGSPADIAMDKKMGLKEGSPKDEAIDKKMQKKLDSKK